MSQESLESQLRTPDCLLVDFAKMEAPSQLHTAFMALHQFSLSHDGELPRARSLVLYIAAVVMYR